MNVLVVTSVWSLAMRRDVTTASLHVERLAKLLSGGAAVFTTGVILQELLQGFAGPKARDRILASFAALPFWFLRKTTMSTRRSCATTAGARVFKSVPSTP